MQNGFVETLIGAAVVVLAGIAVSTGFREVPLSENPWMSVRFGSDAPSRPGMPSEPGSPRATQRTIEADGATSAKVRIEQALGEMTIEGGSDSLMDATFDTRPPGWIPEVSYSVEGTVGTQFATASAVSRRRPRFAASFSGSLNSQTPIPSKPAAA